MKYFFEAFISVALSICAVLAGFAVVVGAVLLAYATLMAIGAAVFAGTAWIANLMFGLAIPLKTAAVTGAAFMFGRQLLVAMVQSMRQLSSAKLRWAMD
jgi:hypothetical protein